MGIVTDRAVLALLIASVGIFTLNYFVHTFLNVKRKSMCINPLNTVSDLKRASKMTNQNSTR